MNLISLLCWRGRCCGSREHSAVEVELRAGGVGGFVARKIDGDGSNFFDGAEAIQRSPSDELRDVCFAVWSVSEHGFPHWCQDRGGLDGVAADVESFFGAVERDGLGVVADRGFA